VAHFFVVGPLETGGGKVVQYDARHRVLAGDKVPTGIKGKTKKTLKARLYRVRRKIRVDQRRRGERCQALTKKANGNAVMGS